MVDAANPEEKRRIAIIRVDGSNTSRTSDAIGWILCEVISSVLDRTVELRLKAGFGDQLTCSDGSK